MRRWRNGAALALAVNTLGIAAAFGVFNGAASAAHTLDSATLEPASNLAASTSCGPLLSFSAKANLSWTATPSGFATGYKVERYLGSTLQNTTTVTPPTTVALAQSGLATGTTYTWKLYAYKANWTAPVIQVSATTPGLCL